MIEYTNRPRAIVRFTRLISITMLTKLTRLRKLRKLSRLPMHRLVNCDVATHDTEMRSAFFNS